jgi:hypothetical protein
MRANARFFAYPGKYIKSTTDVAMTPEIIGLRVARKSWCLYIDAGDVEIHSMCIACAISSFGPVRARYTETQPGAEIFPGCSPLRYSFSNTQVE